MITIKATFDEIFKDIKFDKALIDRLYRFQVWFVNLNQEHLRFFGSNLIGVHTVRWRVTEDTNRFYRDIFGLETQDVSEKTAMITTIEQKFATISDPVNLTIMYVIHRFLSEVKLNEKDRHRGAYDAALIFFYRALAIRQSEYFKKFPADPKIAEAAYAKLSRKFLIRQLGTWGRVVEYRAEALIAQRPSDEQQLHYNTLLTFSNDEKIANAIADSANRIRDLYKNYMVTFYEAIEEGESIHISSSTIVDMEGIEKIRDKIKHVDNSIALVNRLIGDQPSFVRQDLINVISDINTNTSKRMIEKVLIWISAESSQPANFKLIDRFVKMIVVHTFHMLQESGLTKMSDLPYLLVTLKNLYLSTRSTDKDLEEIREMGGKIVTKSTEKVNKSLALATRTSVILYIALFAIISHR